MLKLVDCLIGNLRHSDSFAQDGLLQSFAANPEEPFETFRCVHCISAVMGFCYCKGVKQTSGLFADIHIPDDTLNISVKELLCVGMACGHHLWEVNQGQLVLLTHLREHSFSLRAPLAAQGTVSNITRALSQCLGSNIG